MEYLLTFTINLGEIFAKYSIHGSVWDCLEELRILDQGKLGLVLYQHQKDVCFFSEEVAVVVIQFMANQATPPATYPPSEIRL